MPVDLIAERVEEHYQQITIVEALQKLLTAKFDQLSAGEKQTQQACQTERSNLLAKRKQLLDAHFAGAIPIDLLKKEQDHIARRLAWLDSQLATGNEILDNAKAHLKATLDLCSDAYQLYMNIDDNLRLCNQAFSKDLDQ